MSASQLLEISGATVAYGQVMALQGLACLSAAARCVALVGSNGAGKTALSEVHRGTAAAGERRPAAEGRKPRESFHPPAGASGHQLFSRGTAGLSRPQRARKHWRWLPSMTRGARRR